MLCKNRYSLFSSFTMLDNLSIFRKKITNNIYYTILVFQKHNLFIMSYKIFCIVFLGIIFLIYIYSWFSIIVIY